ncbi:hypothetical protein [Actinomadura flavalba]|uniref:hypothetical protein n=1 Tax=Actinomadura flavalba TaxID=1120938 RepID=UPI0003724BBA|nr:hypothetical protein [Actinomadura flavalba]
MAGTPPSRVRLAARILTTATVAAGALLAVQAPASATTFPETYLADNSTHTYCFKGSGWSTARKDAVVYGMKRLGDTTDMTVRYETGSKCSNTTDIHFYASNLKSGVRGDATCMKWVKKGKCDRARVRMDFPELDKGSNDWYDRRKTVVHEVGHTIGLGHHSPKAHQCAMRSGEIPNTSLTYRSYHAHDRGHLNKAY